VSLLKFN